jgi:hypothetical protein
MCLLGGALASARQSNPRFVACARGAQNDG